MSFLETLMGGQHEAAIEQIAAKLGLNPSAVQSAMAQLMPALAAGMQQQAAGGNTAAVAQTLQNPVNVQYADSPETLAAHDSQQGTEVAHQLLGGAQQASAVAQNVAESTGIHPDKLKALLPMAASLFAGAVARSAAGSGGVEGLLGSLQNVRAGGLGGVMGSITHLMDANNGGSAVTNILGFFKSKAA